MRICSKLILVGFCILLSSSIRVEAQSYTWSQPDQELPVERKSMVLSDCDAFLKSIPTRSQIAKQENAWLGSIYYGVDWQLAKTNEVDDTIGMSLELGLQDCRLKVNVYSWEGILESKMDKFYDAFYLQIKERTKLLQHVIKTGKVDESDFTNFDPLFKDSLQYYIQFFKNSLNQEDVPNLDLESFIEAMDGGINPLMYTDYGFKFKRKDGIYYFHEDDLERFLDVLYFSVAKINHFFDTATSYGFSTKKVLGLNNVDCNVCCNLSYNGTNVQSGWGFLLSNYKAGSFELSLNHMAMLDRIAAFLIASDLDVYAIEGRAAKSEGSSRHAMSYVGNQNLSQLRALEVQKYLKGRGVNVSDSQVICLGSEDPLSSQLDDKSIKHERSVSVFVTRPYIPSSAELAEKNKVYLASLNKPQSIPNQSTRYWAISLDTDASVGLDVGVGLGIVGIKGRLRNMESRQTTDFVMAIPTIGVGVGVSFSCSNGGPTTDDNFIQFTTTHPIDDPKYFENVLMKYLSFSLGAKIDILGLSADFSILEFPDGFATPQGIATISHPTTLGIGLNTGTVYMWVGDSVPD